MNMRRDGGHSSALRSFSFSFLLCTLLPLGNGFSTTIQSSFTGVQGAELDEISMSATVGFFGPLDTMALWQLPPSGRPVRKVLVIFVASNCPPGQFWDASPSCPRGICSGLPESRRIVLDALTRDYAVFIPTPIENDWTADTWPPNSHDLNNVFDVISQWKYVQGLESVPTVGLGMSAGGHAVSVLAVRPGLFQSITIMISAGKPALWDNVPNDYPPTFFIHMPKDDRTEAEFQTFTHILSSQGVLTGDAKWTEQPVTENWFSERIPGLDFDVSAKIVAVYKQEGWIDENNLLIDNGNELNWRAILKSRNILPLDPKENGKLMFEDSIAQEMNVAYARHVTLSRRDEEMFAWFEGAYEHQTLATF